MMAISLRLASLVCFGLLLLESARAFPAEDSAQVSAEVNKPQTAQNLAASLLGAFGKSLNADPERASTPVSKRMYDIIENLLVNVLRPQPIIDNIKEEEKYGNTGQMFDKVGRQVVNGAESITTFIASVADLPVNALKSLSRQVTKTLNVVGSKVVGLSR